MKKKIGHFYIAIGMLFIIPLLSCGNAESKINTEKETENVLADKSSPGNLPATESSSLELEKAKNDGKTVFLVVFNKEGADKDKALKIAKDASAKKAKETKVIELNTGVKANSDLVTKFRLAGAPLPLIIVIDINGNAAGGVVLADATVDVLLNIIPSPKFSEVLKALTEQKGLLVVAYKEGMENKSKAIEKCKKAIQLMNNSAVLVELDIDNTNEASLMKQLQVDFMATEPVIFAINKNGQVTGNFDIKASTNELKNATKKVIQSGCGSGCKPGGC